MRFTRPWQEHSGLIAAGRGRATTAYKILKVQQSASVAEGIAMGGQCNVNLEVKGCRTRAADADLM